MNDLLLHHNCLVGVIIYLLCFIKKMLIPYKRAIKFGAPKFWPSRSHQYRTVGQTASNWNLQKLLKL